MYTSILVPIDIEHESSWRKSLLVAVRLAADHGAKLHVLYVVPPFGSSLVGSFFPENYEEQLIEKAKTSLADIVSRVELHDIKPKLHIAHGVVYEETIRSANKVRADLIVVAANRPELSDYLLGPNAARVVRHAHQSVFVVRE